MKNEFERAIKLLNQQGIMNDEKEIKTWQDYWREAGPIRFSEELLTCPLDVPIHPESRSNPNVMIEHVHDFCPYGKIHRKFRDNGVPYHIILSDEQRTFLTDIWKNNVRMALIAAARGAGKTFVFGVFDTWKISVDNKSKITCMGGSSEQSAIIQEYIDDWRIDIPDLTKIIDKSLKGIKRYCKTIGRSICRFPACSPTAARGPHVNIVEIDEACQAEDKSEDGYKAVQAIQWQTTGKRDTIILLASTAHYIHGMFYEYMTKPEYGFKTYFWSIARHISGEKDPYKVYTDKDPKHWKPNVWWLTQTEIEDKRRSKSDEEWLCEALGGASMASGSVFKKDDLKVVFCEICDNCEPYKWGKCKLVELGQLGVEEDPTKFIIERMTGFDYGTSEAPCALTVVGRKVNVVFVLFNDEQRGLREEEKLDWIHTNCQERKSWTIVPDPAEGGKHLNEKLTDMGYAVYTIAENEKISRVFNTISHVEKHKMVIPKAFWFLTQSLKKLAWDKDNKIRKIDDHSFDSLCYAMVDYRIGEGEFSLFEDIIKEKRKPPKVDDIFGIKG